MRRPRALLLCLLPLLLGIFTAAQEPAARAKHVVIISIDGLRPDYYLPSPSRLAKMPALDALRARGSWAEGVVGQFPSLT